VSSQRQQKSRLARKVFEERVELLEWVVVCTQSEVLRSQKNDREHSLQSFQKNHLVGGGKAVLRKFCLFLLVRSNLYDDLRNGDGYRLADELVPWHRIYPKKDIRNENEYREPQIRHIPVKKLEQKLSARL